MVRRDAAGAKIAIFYLFLAIQECIDLAPHWVADAGWGPADDATSAFDELADRGAIVRDLADPLCADAGLRWPCLAPPALSEVEGSEVEGSGVEPGGLPRA